MIRYADLQDVKRHQQELIKYAEERRLAARSNRPEKSTSWSPSALRLRRLRPLLARLAGEGDR